MRAYQDMVFSTAARLTANDAQAEDIAQEVFLRAYENFEQVRHSPTAGGWLKTVATNLSLNHLSRYRRRWRFFSELRTEEQDDDGPEFDFTDPDAPDSVLEALVCKDRREQVEQALQKLPDHQRIPLVLYHFEERSYEDIAQALSISLSKLKSDILRGRAALARNLIRTLGQTSTEELAL